MQTLRLQTTDLRLEIKNEDSVGLYREKGLKSKVWSLKSKVYNADSETTDDRPQTENEDTLRLYVGKVWCLN